MNTKDIILSIDAEIERLQQVKSLLTGSAVATKRKPGRPAGSKSSATVGATPLNQSEKPAKRRSMSAEGRAKIAAAQKARWAKSRRASKTAGLKSVRRPAKKIAKKVARKTVPK